MRSLLLVPALVLALVGCPAEDVCTPYSATVAACYGAAGAELPEDLQTEALCAAYTFEQAELYRCYEEAYEAGSCESDDALDRIDDALDVCAADYR